MENQKIITADKAGERVDKFLSQYFPNYSRNYFARLIKSDQVKINNTPIKPNQIIKINDIITISFTDETQKTVKASEDINLKIVYEDNDAIVINKDPNVVVHPAAGHTEDTLVNALLNYYPNISNAVYDEDSEISKMRPGIVHRLDKDTSGVIIVAKNTRAMHSFAKQIQNHTATKKYLALCSGWPKDEKGILTNYLGRNPKNRKLISDIGQEKGKEAISKYEVKEKFLTKSNKRISLIEFDIKTGRTHQIRVQISKIGHPVLGDQFYGNKESEKVSSELNIKRQMLHAYELSITLPGENKARTFKAEPPEDFKAVLNQIPSE